MADIIHMALAKFRDEILMSTARLEFQLRDMTMNIPALNTSYSNVKNPNSVPYTWEQESVTESNHSAMEALEQRIKVLEASIQMLIATKHESSASSHGSIENDLLTMQVPEDTRNILVKSHRGTPALAAAVAAANAPLPPALALSAAAVNADGEGEVEEADAEADEEASVVEEQDEAKGENDDAPTLTRMVLNNQVYFLDEENTAYQETEDGYEEVGKFNPITKRIEVTVEEEEEVVEEDVVEEEVVEEEEGEEEGDEAEEEEEEGIEVEEFEFKGKTYQRDTENNVYLDGEHIGTWNGKKILPLT